MGGTLTLSADFLNLSFFIYKLDPIYGNLLLKYYRNVSYKYCFLIEAKKEISFLQTPKNENLF